MYLVFIDEHGTINENDPQSKHYILTAMVMQEKGMKFLHHETQKLKKMIWNTKLGFKNKVPMDFELHMTDIISAKRRFKSLRHNKETTEDILRSIYNFISRLYITIITIIITKKEFYTQYTKKEFLPWALRLIIERINKHVASEVSAINDKEYALLILDQDFSTDKEKRNFISKMMEDGIKYMSGDVNFMLDAPIFLKSELHNGIQLVDAIAYLMGRYTRNFVGGSSLTLIDTLSSYFFFSLRNKFYGGIPTENSSKGIKFFPGGPPSGFYDALDENNW